MAEEQVERPLTVKGVTHASYEHQLFSTPLPCQVLSPLAKNLFQRAISEIGEALTPGMVRKDIRPVADVGLILDNSGTLSFALLESLCVFLSVGFS